MTVTSAIRQIPFPGTRRLLFRGDVIEFTLELHAPASGRAWLRTNIGHACKIRREIIRAVTHRQPPLGRPWYDIPMKRKDDRRFRLTLGLAEVGHFEAKSFFLPDGESDPLWPEGPNVEINVEPADTCCGNTIYNAFVRQFGPNKNGRFSADQAEAEHIRRLDSTGYTVIPPSGTFRDLIRELDFILGTLGCRILHLLPIHPTPTTYGRMGRFGSPYAALNFTAVDPALAVFDPKATPMEQFLELVDAVHARQAKLFIDIAINHTGWAASLHETHPQWLVRDGQGRIEMPGAWGVTWEDLTRLDYRFQDLWKYVADMFLTWCRRGVDGFRCDAGYMVPVEAWRYIVSTVRDQYPDTIFFLEGLGGKISVTRDILNKANFNWAYSELFQNYDRGQIESYLPGALGMSGEDGIHVHFAETHDNRRLASVSHAYARMRTTLCALCSVQGGFGFANGVEWYAAEKIDVHGSPSLNWGGEPNLVAFIRRLNHLLTNHPAFQDNTDIRMVQEGPGNVMVLLRHHRPTDIRILAVVNLDAANPSKACWKGDAVGMGGGEVFDLISGECIHPGWDNGLRFVSLAPGQALCLSDRSEPQWTMESGCAAPFAIPDRVRHQILRAKALEIHQVFKGVADLEGFDPERSARDLAENPDEFCRRLNPEGDETRLVRWVWPKDRKRQVMVPPGHFLMVTAESAFRARLVDHDDNGYRVLASESSLPGGGSGFYAIFNPLPASERHRDVLLELNVYGETRHERTECPLLYLNPPANSRVRRMFGRSTAIDEPLLMLGTNGRGAMMRAQAAWGELESKYDALLAANLHPEYPEDRWIMFTRCRAWVVYQGFSQDVAVPCLDRFCFDYESRGLWRFKLPSGQGQHVILSIDARLVHEQNRIHLMFTRGPGDSATDILPDQAPVRLILRPDIEDRNFHGVTKAYTGPEHEWPRRIRSRNDGFVFTPHPDRRLDVRISRGRFMLEPEWRYMVFHPKDADRGMDPHSDLFSPGYFDIELKGGENTCLTAQIAKQDIPVSRKAPETNPPAVSETTDMSLDHALTQALEQYVVRRKDFYTVIAGYPWFLDWGRDTLIVVRGLIAAGFLQESKAIIRQFARFEDRGTLPNMIRGDDAGNRDTSDAPLWFFVACEDLARAAGDAFLEESIGERSIRDVLISLARACMAGTPNGIRMDPDWGLVFSPAHFTWMDTNHPAGTPREGYPVEIQALWFRALNFLARIDAGERKKWASLAHRVRATVSGRFFLETEGYLSDCLHAPPGRKASEAEIDDALRPNQLFALTLGLIDDPVMGRRILENCAELLVPGAIRTLSDRPVKRPLPIWREGRLLNDPRRPYQGMYTGDEDTRRKPAYHNGTAWTWVFPSFCEAWAMMHGASGRKTALALLGSGSRMIDRGCAGHVPEILDGDYPHTQRGCDAQAWGVSEYLRVWRLLNMGSKV